MDSSTVELAARLILGAIVLFAGRNMFWLFIAAIGFLVGVEFAETWLAGHPMWMILAFALGAGLLGAALAVIFERLGFALAGFYATVFLSLMYAEKLGFGSAAPGMLFVLGLVGALLVALLTDWAIILFSAVAGAAAIMSVFALQPLVEGVCLVVLAAMGVMVQRAMLQRRQSSS